MPKITLGFGVDFRPFVSSKQYISTSSPSMISSPCEPLVTCIIVQISHHNRSKATGTAAENCHNVCPHLRFLREEMLLCCQRSFEVWEHMERKMAILMSLGNLSPASSWCLCSRLSQLRMIVLLCLRCSVCEPTHAVDDVDKSTPLHSIGVKPFGMLPSLSIYLYLARALANSQSKRNPFLWEQCAPHLHCCVLLFLIVLFHFNQPQLRRVAFESFSTTTFRKDVTQIGLCSYSFHFQLFVRDSFLEPQVSRLNVSLPSQASAVRERSCRR